LTGWRCLDAGASSGLLAVIAGLGILVGSVFFHRHVLKQEPETAYVPDESYIDPTYID
jgi:hypothetical protein